MNDKDRIRLAEAMGHKVKESGSLWSESGGPLNNYFLFRGPGYEMADILIWNPFTNPADDYAVLEWMRNEGKGRYDDFCNALAVQLDNDHFNYRTGDYARAALKVLSEEEGE